ncbi:hypothetical protein ABKA04_008814 [Annulohypoxylon sp. FPYF3050]
MIISTQNTGFRLSTNSDGASVKVMTATESVEECPEFRIMKVLADVSNNELRENHINVPREHFWIDGPNGRHLCFVSDLLGPSLFMNYPDGMGLHNQEELTDLTFQVSKGLQYLHRKGICHGDPPDHPKWNRQYAAPELLFTKTLSGPPQDIWALACTIFEIKLQMPLFSEYQDYTSLIRQIEVWFGPLPAQYRQLARTYLGKDEERKLSYQPTKPRVDSPQPPADELSPKINHPLSLSVEEAREKRAKFIGKSDWSNPLQATLGGEQDCSVYVKNYDGYTGYTSSDDTDSSADSLDDGSQDWSSEDENSQGDIYAQADLIYDAIEEDVLGPGNLDEDTHQDEDSPQLQIADASEIKLGHEEESVDMPPTPSEGDVATLEQRSSSSETESATSEIILRELLAKRDAEESSEDKDTKQQRTSESPPKTRGEWVTRKVSMPREEVLLLSDLLSRMFKHDPKERLDIDAVLNHDFWGDRRYNWPRDRGNDIEDIPDPISSRTRSRTSKVSQTGQETEPSQDVKSDKPVEGEPTDDVKG